MAKGKTTPWYDKKVFNQFKEALGGRVKYFVVGGAPLSPEAQQFLAMCSISFPSSTLPSAGTRHYTS